MKKIVQLVFGICLFIGNAYAEPQKCFGKQAEVLDGLERNLNNCKIDYGQQWQTADILGAYDKAEECVRSVADEIFDLYYVRDNTKSKESFDRYVSAIRELGSSLAFGSDWAKENHLAEVYTLEAEGTVYFMMKDIVKSYLDKLRSECGERVEIDEGYKEE